MSFLDISFLETDGVCIYERLILKKQVEQEGQ